MKNILVTGGCGFIGSNFVRHITNLNEFHVIILDKLTYAGSITNLEKINEQKYNFINGDICDEHLVNNIFEKYKPSAVFHFAAESHVDRSIDGPKDFIKTNIFGTYNLLQSSRAIHSKHKDDFKFVHISTDEVYGDLEDVGYFTEHTPYAPSSPYSASKAASDHLVRAWGKTYELPTIITNCSNNYGAYQFPEKLIPLMIINCLNWKPLPVYGDGKNVRDWLHVTDHCSAIETVYRYGLNNETYNIGGNNEIKNIDIVNLICDYLDENNPSSNGSYRELIKFVKDRPGHDLRYAIDSTKIKNTLDWEPKESFLSGIEKTIKWYVENKSWWTEIQKNKYNQKRLGLSNL